jgi:hypothetical protein
MRRLLILVVVFLTGCGGASSVTVTGTVTLDSTALSGAEVSFKPASKETTGLGGSGTTNAEGKFTLTDARGGSGLAPGDYKVVISRRLRPDGTAPPADVPPMESDAKETLPPTYSDLTRTILTVKVAADKTVHDFPLKKTGK